MSAPEALYGDDLAVTIGRHTYAGSSEGITFRAWLPDERIRVGAFCSFSAHVVVLAGGEHRINQVSSYPLEDVLCHTAKNRHYRTTQATVIGNDVWVGYGAAILGGAEIGDGAVIGARAVVRGKVPPYAIVAGNPAKVVAWRFPKPVIAALLRIRWWDWPDEKIRERIEDFYEPIADFVAKYDPAPSVAAP